MGLQTAISALQDIVGAVSGIKKAPDYAPDSINAFPFSVAYADSGTFENVSADFGKALHTLIVEIHVARVDLPASIKNVMEYGDSVPAAILAKPTLNNTVSTFRDITYTFGPLDWGTTKTIGFRFQINGVKILS